MYWRQEKRGQAETGEEKIKFEERRTGRMGGGGGEREGEGGVPSSQVSKT
jgi:hypothetical protein